MEIELRLEDDSHNGNPTDKFRIRRGGNRPDNFVITIGDRQIEVKAEDLTKAVNIL